MKKVTSVFIKEELIHSMHVAGVNNISQFLEKSMIEYLKYSNKDKEKRQLEQEIDELRAEICLKEAKIGLLRRHIKKKEEEELKLAEQKRDEELNKRLEAERENRDPWIKAMKELNLG